MKKILFIFLTFFITLHATTNLKYLTFSEKQWLQKNREFTVGITKIPNQVLLSKDGKYRGFSIDLFHLIEKKSGIKFKFIYYKSWNKLLLASKNNKIDIIFLAQKTTSRLKYLYFTDTVLSLQNKIIVNIDNKFHSLEALQNHKVAITKGSALEEYIKYYYPKIILVPTKNELQSLKYVSSKKVDASVLELVRASYYIRQHNLKNLMITADIQYNYYLSIASSKELPELNIILSKTLTALKKKEIASLKLKWGYIKEKKLFFDKQTLIYFSIAFGIIIPFSFYLFLINNRLKKEMREKEKALQRIIKLRDSKLNDMSEIISMIAHQWRQPLNNLSLLTQLLVSKYKKNLLDEELIDYFQKHSKEQMHLMSSTIDDFIELFKTKDEKEDFDIKIMIKNLIEIVNPVLKKEQIKVIFHCDNDMYIINNHQNMLFQIILNIINNAKDALQDINDREKKITITLFQREKKNIIQIHDNGIGIQEEIIDQIFNPYFSTKKEKNGTGLGLYMAKIIIEERLKGTISVKKSTQGAFFEIII